jgi:serine protease inhibitor
MKDFLSDVEELDFSEHKLAAQKMNSWIEKQTHSRINEIAKPGEN